MTTVLEARGVSKRFGRVQALHDVSLALETGELLALVGDNGAGKSTFIKILSGDLQPDAGQIFVDGQAVNFREPGEALRTGIETVYQDLALCETLDVASNLFLGRELTWKVGPLRVLRTREMERRAAGLISRLGVQISSPAALVRGLSGGQRQATAVARAAAWGRRVVIFDEPTAALGVKETARTLGLLRQLRREGHSIIMISHNMAHVFELADRIMILRQGRRVDLLRREKTTPEEVVRKMTGLGEVA